MKILAVIPARYAATRLPGKPLVSIAGKPMIQHVYERAKKSIVDEVIVATDDERIVSACASFGAKAVMTPPELPSGTDRVAYVAKKMTDFGGVLNVQGDEPLMEPETVSAVADLLRHDDVMIATAIVPGVSETELQNPNVVKAVVAQNGGALYFSRSSVPFVRNSDPKLQIHFRHLGIYGFKREILFDITDLAPSPLEKTESLEQLRWLEAGYRIHCAKVKSQSVGVDTAADVEAVEKILQNGK